MDEWEYDPCDDCTAYGDDYYTDENGEMQSSCYDCPFYNRLDKQRLNHEQLSDNLLARE